MCIRDSFCPGPSARAVRPFAFECNPTRASEKPSYGHEYDKDADGDDDNCDADDDVMMMTM
eukprot:483754-Pyramimonas_sp.AAC.1